MSIHRIRKLVSEQLDDVNQTIQQHIIFEHPLIAEMTQHLLNGGGKQLRPLLTLLICKAFNYQGKHHIALAAMIEFFHTATLLHDDVIDESKLRRGRETAHEIWGNKASVLIGDYLFTLHTRLLLEIGDLSVLGIMAKIANQIGYGEIKQLVNKNQYDMSVEDYFEIIEAKTSLLFAAATNLAARISGQTESMCDKIHHFGLHLGNAFQLIDDALDYGSDSLTIGKNIGDDLADGKATLPLIFALKHGTDKQKQLIQTSLKHGLRDNLPLIIETLVDTGALEFTKQTATTQAEIAKTYLEDLPDSPYKEALFELTEYSIIREH